MSDIVQKLWGFCHTLRHDGVDYGDYIEQLTYLLFLKMAEERGAVVPKNHDWASLKAESGTALTDHYADILRKLREQPGILGDIFAQATPRFNNPVNLKRVIAMIDEEDWSAMDVDVKGAAFEGLLEKAASEGKKGAGQYFTPRPLIQTICKVMKPDPRGNPDFRLCDPACGTGGFLVCAWEWLARKLTTDFTDFTDVSPSSHPRHPRNPWLNCSLHTVVRLPRGKFTPYSQGVKANVIFLQKGKPTENVWIFDARSNVPGITKKDRPLTAAHFEEFEKAYGKDPNGLSKRSEAGLANRFKKFHISDIKERGYKLDVTWLKDDSLEDSDELPEPQDLASEAITELESVVDDLREIITLLEKEEGVEK
jgi:type I restriction-modification system DNA methylase subunit